MISLMLIAISSTALDDVLQEAGADDLAQGGLGAFYERLADVGNGEGDAVGLVDVVIDDRSALLFFVS